MKVQDEHAAAQAAANATAAAIATAANAATIANPIIPPLEVLLQLFPLTMPSSLAKPNPDYTNDADWAMFFNSMSIALNASDAVETDTDAADDDEDSVPIQN
ncbi:hypothetical protein MUCCIDRAFT_114610 [Mucor lusitanicus CBS 277.49]|uniref:Uncharacterized protein n=1 Tax=Mucor lusitanicus CBS 277.49 TaxID=747725 RepID=A0A168I0Y2_MUCCL|nr:hypothetical protein MUCCIDRAFT_114610 [Mucor lusitanicus CBS 277.49]